MGRITLIIVTEHRCQYYRSTHLANLATFAREVAKTKVVSTGTYY